MTDLGSTNSFPIHKANIQKTNSDIATNITITPKIFVNLQTDIAKNDRKMVAISST